MNSCKEKLLKVVFDIDIEADGNCTKKVDATWYVCQKVDADLYSYRALNYFTRISIMIRDKIK